MTTQPPRMTTLGQLGPLPFHADDRRRYWRTLCQVGPVVFVDQGWFGHPTYFITTEPDVLSVLRDGSTYVRDAPITMSRGDRAAVMKALKGPAFGHELERELRARASQILADVGTVNFYEIHQRAHPYACGTVEHEFTLALFQVLAGASPNTFRRLDGAGPEGPQFPEWIDLGVSQFLSRLPDEGRRSIVNHVAAAGWQNVQESVLLVILALTVDRDQRSKLHGRRDLIPRFVDQLLTLQGVASLTILRRNTRPVTLSGIGIPKDSRIELCIGPVSIEAFHAGKAKQDLTFGYGQHRCIGALLTRQALVILTEELLELWT